mgnify:CR=1 FL=1
MFKWVFKTMGKIKCKFKSSCCKGEADCEYTPKAEVANNSIPIVRPLDDYY